MSIEDEGHRITKENRRENQESKKKKVVKHQTVLVHHIQDRNIVEGRGHRRDRKAAKGK